MVEKKDKARRLRLVKNNCMHRRDYPVPLGSTVRRRDFSFLHRAEDFGGATTSAGIRGYNRRAQSVDAMTAGDPKRPLGRASAATMRSAPSFRSTKPMPGNGRWAPAATGLRSRDPLRGRPALSKTDTRRRDGRVGERVPADDEAVAARQLHGDVTRLHGFIRVALPTTFGVADFPQSDLDALREYARSSNQKGGNVRSYASASSSPCRSFAAVTEGTSSS